MTELSRLLLVRHGQSIGNVAGEEAYAARAHQLDLDYRDADTPLSDTGLVQASAVGAWLGALPEKDRPTVWLTSPYRRARDTAATSLEAARSDATLLADERLRERDLGILDGFTGYGIRDRFPEEAARRDQIGKFYYRPPGGESWTDVLLRVRSLLTDLRQQYAGERVCVFSHQAVIMSFRVALEQMAEHDVLRVDREDPLPNCSVTAYRSRDRVLELERYADTTAVEHGKAPTTREETAAREDVW